MKLKQIIDPKKNTEKNLLYMLQLYKNKEVEKEEVEKVKTQYKQITEMYKFTTG